MSSLIICRGRILGTHQNEAANHPKEHNMRKIIPVILN
jgi:hypothetical protein